MRHSIEEQPEHAYYRFYAPAQKAALESLARVAGQRWQIEQAFQAAKGECGLDHYEVRHWQGWYRHITLAMLAHATLAVLRARGEKTPDAICSLAFSGADGTALTISCAGPDGDDSTNSMLFAITTENADRLSSSSICNCST